MKGAGRAAALLLAWGQVARAGDVRAPKPLAVDVAYPSDGRGDAVVDLELVITQGGRVRDLRVLAGAEPFLTAAKRAAMDFRFEPATRDGVALSARIRLELPFADPHGHRTVAPATSGHVVSVRAPVNAPIQDVHVRGERVEIGGETLSREDIRGMPGAFGDAFRAIDALPGVVPIASGVPFFFVRGAPPGNTGYFIDGVRVPLLFHLALGPSVVHPSLIDRVEFYPGAFPARYGRFTGGIVAGDTRPPADAMHGEAEVRLYDVGVLGEVPFANNRGDALVAGRFGYPGLIVPLVAPNTQVAYWDYQARVGYRLTPRDTVTAFAFGSFDEIDQREQVSLYGQTVYGSFQPLFRTEFHRADLRWDHTVSGGSLRTALTLGFDDSLAGSTSGDAEHVRAESLQLRTELDQTVSPSVRLRAGADVLLYHYDYDQTLVYAAAPVAIPYPPRNDVIFGAYVDTVWKAAPRVEVVPGLRGDVFTTRSEGVTPRFSYLSLVTGNPPAAVPSLDPRLSARVSVTRAFDWIGTFGLTHQPPSFIVPVPGGDLGALAHGLQSAVQASQGFVAKLPLGFEVKGTLYVQRTFDTTNALATCSSIFVTNVPGVSCLDERTNALSLGVETLVRRSFTRWLAGWVSYTFSRSTVEVPHPLRGEPGVVPSNYDRPNVLNAVLAVDFGNGWHAGARFLYYTGLPFTALDSMGTPVPPFNGHRLADFWRLDARFEKRWRLHPRGEVAVVLEGQNVTLNAEQVSIDCTTHPGVCVPQTIGPITVPSLGVEAKY